MKPALRLLAGDAPTLRMAAVALTADERSAYATYTFEKRRRDWLVGRYAAKLAACEAVAGAWQPGEVGVLSPADRRRVERQPIAPQGDDRRPALFGPDDRLTGWDMSLTHGHGLGAAIVAPAPIGIDLEKLRELPRNGWKFFLSEAEAAWLVDEPLGPQGEIVFWAVKEAAFKAWKGEVHTMPGLAVRIRAGEGPLGVGVAEEGGRRVLVRWVVARGFCLAVATPEPPAGSWPAWFDALSLSDLIP